MCGRWADWPFNGGNPNLKITSGNWTYQAVARALTGQSNPPSLGSWMTITKVTIPKGHPANTYLVTFSIGTADSYTFKNSSSPDQAGTDCININLLVHFN